MCFNCHELIFKSKFYRIQQIVILFNNIVIVIGPTPPGTGDILDTFYNVYSLKTTSPKISHSFEI